MNDISGTQRHPRQRHSGASAVEFALIFPVMFAVAYAAIVYSYVYLLQQSVNFAAQQGAQAAVAVVPQSDIATTTAKRLSNASLAVTNTLSWLPVDQTTRVSVSSPSDCGNGTTPVAGSSFVFRVNFDMGSGTGALFPTFFNLPMIGTIPPLPATLVACAVAIT